MSTIHAMRANYLERIVIAPDDVIPKSSWFKFVKYSLLVALSMLIMLAVVALIVAESPKHNYPMGIGIVSLVGIILFIVGIVGIMKENIPLTLTFSVSMILYLLLFMYSRVITSPGLIILRTCILLLLAVEAFCFCIMIRDWRAIQISRVNQRIMKEVQLAQYAAANGLMVTAQGALVPVGATAMSGYHPQSPGTTIMSPMYTGPGQRRGMYQEQQVLQHQLPPHYPMSQHYIPQQQQNPYRQPNQQFNGRQQMALQHHQQQPLHQQGMQYPNRPLPGRATPQQLQHGRTTPQLHPGHTTPQMQHHPQRYHNPNQQHVTMNPYIQVDDEDENPYATIGEPTPRVYSQSRFYVPADRY